MRYSDRHLYKRESYFRQNNPGDGGGRGWVVLELTPAQVNLRSRFNLDTPGFSTREEAAGGSPAPAQPGIDRQKLRDFAAREYPLARSSSSDIATAEDFMALLGRMAQIDGLPAKIATEKFGASCLTTLRGKAAYRRMSRDPAEWPVFETRLTEVVADAVDGASSEPMSAKDAAKQVLTFIEAAAMSYLDPEYFSKEYELREEKAASEAFIDLRAAVQQAEDSDRKRLLLEAISALLSLETVPPEEYVYPDAAISLAAAKAGEALYIDERNAPENFDYLATALKQLINDANGYI